MSILDAAVPTWRTVGEFYEITRKPRSVNKNAEPTVLFAPMDGIPLGGEYAPRYDVRDAESVSSGTYFERGDLLVAKITPSFENGKQALAHDLPRPFGYATTEVIPLRPRSADHDPRFLFFYLLHPDIRAFVAERMEGSTGRQRVPESALLELQIPVFELQEQQQISDLLERVQRCMRLESQLEQATSKLKSSAMRELFSRGLRGEAQKDTEIGWVPESWRVVTLGSLGRVGNGSTPKRTSSEYWIGGDIPWLTSSKVYDREIVAADQFVTRRALTECHLPMVTSGAILIAITGQGKTLGHCAVLRTNATVNQHIAYVSVDESLADSSFLRGYIETQYDYLRQVGAGGGSTKGALTCAFLRQLSIPLPDLDEQREISRILDSIDRKVALHQRKRAVLESLFRSLLHKLMTGEIRVADLNLAALDAQAPAGTVA